MDGGAVVINGKQLNTEILLPEFMNLFPEFRRKGWKISPGYYVSCAPKCDCDGRFFTVTVRFQRKRLNQVRLYPEEGGAEEDVEKTACDTWLLERFGTPHEKKQNITMYEYEWGCVATEYNPSMEPAYSIVIDFN